VYQLKLQEILDAKGIRVKTLHDALESRFPNKMTVQTVYNYYHNKASPSLENLGYILETLNGMLDKDKNLIQISLPQVIKIDSRAFKDNLKQAERAFREANYSEAEQAYKLAQDETEKRESVEERLKHAFAFIGRGTVARSQGDLDTSYRYCRAALGEFIGLYDSYQQGIDFQPQHKTDLYEGLARALNGLGNAERIVGRFNEAWERYQDAIDWLRHLEPNLAKRSPRGQTEEGRAQWCQGESFRCQGDFFKAIRQQRLAQTLFETAQNEDTSWRKGLVLNGLGNIYHNLDQPNWAIHFFEEAHNSDEAHNNKRSLGYSKNNLANAWRKRTFSTSKDGITYDNEDKNNLFHQAWLEHQAALEIFKEIGDQRGIGYTYLGIAHHLISNSKSSWKEQEVLRHLEDAKEIFIKSRDIRGEIYSLSRMADVAKRLGKLDDAIHYNLLAHDKFKKITKTVRLRKNNLRVIRDRHGELNVLKDLAQLNLQLGSARELEQARKYLDEIREMFAQIDENEEGSQLSKFIQEHNYLRAFASTYLSLGELKYKEAKQSSSEQNFTDAENLFRKAHDIAVFTSDRKEEAKSYQRLAEVKIRTEFEVGMNYYYVAKRIYTDLGNQTKIKELDQIIEKYKQTPIKRHLGRLAEDELISRAKRYLSRAVLSIE